MPSPTTLPLERGEISEKVISIMEALGIESGTIQLFPYIAMEQQLLDALKQTLRFYLRDLTNLRGDYPIRVGDTIKFSVYARNVSRAFTIKNIHVTLYSGGATSFDTCTIDIERLAPLQARKLREITAEVVANPNESGSDKIAVVDATAYGDFSSVKFSDQGELFALINPA
jgi:hypothetical protein